MRPSENTTTKVLYGESEPTTTKTVTGQVFGQRCVIGRERSDAGLHEHHRGRCAGQGNMASTESCSTRTQASSRVKNLPISVPCSFTTAARHGAGWYSAGLRGRLHSGRIPDPDNQFPLLTGRPVQGCPCGLLSTQSYIARPTANGPVGSGRVNRESRVPRRSRPRMAAIPMIDENH